MVWSTLYNRHLEEINTDLIDILGLLIDEVESEILDEEKENLIEDEASPPLPHFQNSSHAFHLATYNKQKKTN
ncbi:hypothetical protein RclHR1_12370006 [Rhizophagus clarus]|uniref:Uncharacterized protein n=1 Tax=Rhizophagus clarus TaxID=94130 RepID=A0A2Z6Q712_9GLOM|nr:hypothetical protein RclHR1_12370006 [Rhizophagus clarus]GES96501.1 hypothetical protein RCL_e28966_RclHR1_12370006 [Rhizophagus clarus]